MLLHGVRSGVGTHKNPQTMYASLTQTVVTSCQKLDKHTKAQTMYASMKQSAVTSSWAEWDGQNGQEQIAKERFGNETEMSQWNQN